MARKRGGCGHKLEGAQADVKAEESKRGPELKKDDVVVKVEESDIGTKLTMNEDRHDIDDILDYVEVKLEDLELEGDEMDELTTPKTEKNEGGAPLKPKKKKKKKNKNKKKRSQEAKSESEAAVQVKSESTALPNPEMNIAPKATDGGCGAYPKPKEEKRAKIEADFFAKWDEYFGKRELADWQRLCRDLGLPGDLPSKTQCRKVSQNPPPFPLFRQENPIAKLLS
ncbi:hypothetical protein LZ32DRAFT_612643 [Colletotrichum eremochloae]|nr:hypothetical protein LZ32DRAFT_612643 [Colletotrichum eremochloae]